MPLKVIQTGTIRKLWCGFLFAFLSNYGSILHHLRDKARYWSKIVIFSYPLVFDAHVRGVAVGILPSRLVWENFNGGATRWWKNFEDMCNRWDSIPACGGHKDGRTSCHGIVRALRIYLSADNLLQYTIKKVTVPYPTVLNFAVLDLSFNQTNTLSRSPRYTHFLFWSSFDDVMQIINSL